MHIIVLSYIGTTLTFLNTEKLYFRLSLKIIRMMAPKYGYPSLPLDVCAATISDDSLKMTK